MKKDKPRTDILYICTGKNRTCRKTGCYYKNRGPCMRTLNPKYARNGVVTDPKKYPERFEPYNASYGGATVTRYYERSNQDDQ